MFSPRNTRKSFSRWNITRNLGIWDQSRDSFGSALPGSGGSFPGSVGSLWNSESGGKFQNFGSSSQRGWEIPSHSRGEFPLHSVPKGNSIGNLPLHPIPEGKFLFIPSFFQVGISSSSHSKGKFQREFSPSSHSIGKFPLHSIPKGKFLFFPFQRQIPSGIFLFIPFLILAFPRILPIPAEHSTGE